MANDIIVVQGIEIKVTQRENEDYISLTDMCKAFGDGDQLIKNWLQNKNTIEFLQVWEELNNPNFNLVELHQIKNNVGLNRFVMSVKKWSTTNAIGLIAKTGRYGSGTYAHKDIALEFGSWLSPEFKLYLIKEFQRLKQKEAQENKLEWNVAVSELLGAVERQTLNASFFIATKQQFYLFHKFMKKPNDELFRRIERSAVLL